MDIANYLIETADQCALIARQGRILVERLDAIVGPRPAVAQLSDGGLDLSEQVDRIAQSLLAKAVEIDNEQAKKRRSPS
jgi:hypothetical protein